MLAESKRILLLETGARTTDGSISPEALVLGV